MDVGEDSKNTLELGSTKYIYCWGFGKYGQIGKKFINYSLNPIQVDIDEKEDAFTICGGESHSAILTLSSKLYIFGKNTFGQLGLGNNNYIYYPIINQISLTEKVIKVSLGGDHTLILTEESALYTWGLNVFGQLGLGDFLARNTPTKIDHLSFLDFYNCLMILIHAIKHVVFVDQTRFFRTAARSGFSTRTTHMPQMPSAPLG